MSYSGAPRSETKSHIIQIVAIELDPDKHYLIAIDKVAGLDMADMKTINSEIKKTGVKRAIVVLIDGNPHDRIATWSTVRRGDEPHEGNE